jgi:glyoxylase-like metal-dependent hydrolase (beta-lactamase superfamily II)
MMGSDQTNRPEIRAFFDEPTNTVSYLVADRAAGVAAVIDPVLDYDHNSGTVDTRSAQAVLDAADAAGLRIEWVLETHAHADHLSGAPYIKAKTGARIGIGEHIKDVQRIFRPIFNADDLRTDGSDFDHLFRDGETFRIGSWEAEVLYTPGHTPADVSYRIGDAVFVGDTMFMPDYGTARADFSRRRRASALSLDQAADGAARRHPPLHVPRLQGAGARRLCLGDKRA